MPGSVAKTGSRRLTALAMAAAALALAAGSLRAGEAPAAAPAEEVQKDSPAATAPAASPAPPQTPPAPADPAAVTGVLTTSDGKKFKGAVSLPANKPLRLWSAAEKRFHDVPLPEIERLTVKVTQEAMEKEFRFKEESSRDKIYSGREFPRQDYAVEVRLRTGKTLSGVVDGLTVFVEGDEARERFILLKKQKGQPGQTLADLVHVESIEFTAPAKEDARATFSVVGAFEGPGKAQRACAVRQKVDDTFEGQARDAGRGFDLKDLPAGVYDLFIETDEALLVGLGFAGETPGDGADDAPLTEADKTAVAARVAEIPDFFREREVLYLRGTPRRAKAVIAFQRDSESTTIDKKEGGGAFIFRRIDYWTLHREGDRWLVDKRLFLTRDRVTPGTPPRPVILDERLKDVALSPAQPTARVSVTLAREK